MFIILQIFLAMLLLEDLKIGEYHSTGEYFIVVAEAFSEAIRQR